MIVNNMFNVRLVIRLRLLLRFYVFYLALINLGLTEGQFKKINSFVFFLFIIQLPASAIKFYFLGVSEETIGTYAVRGGGWTTIIPVVAIGYLSAYYTQFKKNKWLIGLSIGFILFGIVGEKLALLFIFPISFIGLYYLNVTKGKKVNLPRVVLSLTIIFLFSFIVAAATIKYQPRLNKENAVGGSIDFKYALQYSKDYTHSVRADEQTANGRSATTKIVFSTLKSGTIGNKVFGFGPGVLSKSFFDKNKFVHSRIARVAESYGVTGFALFLMEFGWTGVLCVITLFIAFIQLCWRWLNVEQDPYWKAFANGSFVFSGYFLFIFLFYNRVPLLDDTITPVFYYAMAVAFYRLNIYKKNRSEMPQVFHDRD